jgi:hypothetical protein
MAGRAMAMRGNAGITMGWCKKIIMTYVIFIYAIDFLTPS